MRFGGGEGGTSSSEVLCGGYFGALLFHTFKAVKTGRENRLRKQVASKTGLVINYGAELR